MATLQEVSMVKPVLSDEAAEYGILQRGYVYQMKIPLKLSGFFAEPMRFRTSIEENKLENASLKLQHGSVGRLVSGVFPNLSLELHALDIGKFLFVVNIHSEGGHHFFEVKGEILDESLYRKYSRSKMQLNQQGLKKCNVHKLRPIFDHPSSLGKGNQSHQNSQELIEDTKVDIYDNESLLSKHLNQEISIDNLSQTMALKTMFTSQQEHRNASSVAVMNLLSQEEIDEFCLLPTFSGCYFDRKTQTLRLSKSMRSNYEVDPTCSLDTLIEKQRQKELILLEKMERKGQVSSRVIEKLRSASDI